MHEADHSNGELTIGEDLKTLQALPDNLGLELEDVVPASFSSVYGLFLGLERSLGTPEAFHQPRLCPLGESSLLWTVNLH